MDNLIATLRQYWTDRTAREQIMLAAMASLIGLTLLVLGVVQPLMAYRNQAMREFQSALETHITTVENIERWNGLAQNRSETGTDTRSLQTIVAERARQTGLTLSRIQPLETDELSVWVENVPEPVLMRTLIVLKEENSLRIQRISIDRVDGGLVRSQFLLSRTG